MIKIEIQDPHLLDKKVLQETAKYLMGLSGGQLVIPPASADLERYVASKRHMTFKPMEEPQPPVTAVEPIEDEDPLTQEQIEHYRKAERQFLKNIEEECFPMAAPVPTADNFNEGEEALIPVPPETVDITPPAHEIFKPQAPVSSVGLDAKGLPWDRRIHARTKTKIADGSWKRLRGLTEARAVEIELELRSALAAPAAPIPEVPPAPTDEPSAFMDLMKLVTSSITAGRLNREQVVEILKPFGLSSLALVSARPDLIPAIMIKIKGVADAPC